MSSDEGDAKEAELEDDIKVKLIPMNMMSIDMKKKSKDHGR